MAARRCVRLSEIDVAAEYGDLDSVLLEYLCDGAGKTCSKRVVAFETGDRFCRRELHTRESVSRDFRREFSDRKFAEIMSSDAEV